MKAQKYLEELIDQEQDYLSGYDEGEKPQLHIDRLKDLKEALTEVKNCSIPDVSNNEVALKAFVEEFVEAWEDGMGGDSGLYNTAKRLL